MVTKEYITEYFVSKQTHFTKKELIVWAKVGAMIFASTLIYANKLKGPALFALCLAGRGLVGYLAELHCGPKKDRDRRKKFIFKLITGTASLTVNHICTRSALNAVLEQVVKPWIHKPLYWFFMECIVFDVWFNSTNLFRSTGIKKQKDDTRENTEWCLWTKAILHATQYTLNGRNIHIWNVLRVGIFNEAMFFWKDKKIHPEKQFQEQKLFGCCMVSLLNTMMQVFLFKEVVTKYGNKLITITLQPSLHEPAIGFLCFTASLVTKHGIKACFEIEKVQPYIPWLRAKSADAKKEL